MNPLVTDMKSDPKTTAIKADLGMLLSTAEAAQLIGLDPKTLENWRALGKGVKFIRIGERAIRYRPQDVRAFIELGSGRADPQPAGGSSK